MATAQEKMAEHVASKERLELEVVFAAKAFIEATVRHHDAVNALGWLERSGVQGFQSDPEE